MFTIMGNALFGEQFADDYGTIASAFERCLFIMVGEFGPYDDIIATPGLEILARLWFWLYVCIVVFILLNALLAIIVTGYDDATKSVDKTWRDPMMRVVNTARMQLNFARDPVKCQLVMSTEVLMEALDSAIVAVESDGASSRGALDKLEPKFDGGAKIDFSVSEEVVGIYGVKVEECQLARLIEKQGVAAGWVARARVLFLTVSPPFIERTG